MLVAVILTIKLFIPILVIVLRDLFSDGARISAVFALLQ
jgi:hypothetical protein